MILFFVCGAMLLMVTLLVWACGPRMARHAVLPLQQWDPPPSPGSIERLRILSFNIAYGRGPENDIGDRRSAQEIDAYLELIAQTIRDSRADLVCLQEVDTHAARSHFRNQAQILARATGLGHVAIAPVWAARYIPYPAWPPSQHLGRTESAMVILSRYPLSNHQRFLFEKPSEHPFWYNWFYLERGTQMVELDLPGFPLRIFNLHLEAFNPGTRMHQAQALMEVVKSHRGLPAVLCGDFNALPPGATPRYGFTDEPGIDFREDRSMELISQGLPSFRDALDIMQIPDRQRHTFPAPAPTRRLDYILLQHHALEVSGAQVIDQPVCSDHRAVLATIRLK